MRFMTWRPGAIISYPELEVDTLQAGGGRRQA